MTAVVVPPQAVVVDCVTGLVATVIGAAIDTAAYRLVAEPELDLSHYARELAELFDHATAADSARVQR